MWGYFIGGASLLGLLALGHRRHRRWHGHGCGGYGPRGGWHGHGPYGYDGYPSGPRAMLRWLFERLDTSPSQEEVIVQAAEALREQARVAKQSWRSAREDLAKAVRENRVDSPSAFSGPEAAIGELKAAALTQLKRVLDVLDEKQRQRLAEVLERREGPWSARFA